LPWQAELTLSKSLWHGPARAQVYDLFKAGFNEEEARAVMEYIETKTEEKVQQKKEIFLTKDDKVDIIRAIYTTNIIQFLATIGSMIAIFHFMLNR
jgi:hypothetical protein